VLFLLFEVTRIRMICVALDTQKICNMMQSYMYFGIKGIHGS